MNEAVRLLSKRLAGLLVKRPGIAVGIWGEAGIGKTHTVSSLLSETPCRNLSVHATLPVVQLVQRLPQPKSLPVWAERILGRVQAVEFVEPSSLIDLLGALLSDLAPFVIHLEDLHEASHDSLEFVQALAALIKRLKGVGLLVTSRTSPSEAFEAIRLEARSMQDTKAMLEAEAGSSLPPECLEWIQARAAGNPLFALEFFRFLARQGFVWSDGKHWHWRVPDKAMMPITVEALIEQRLQQATQSPTLEVALAAKAILPIGSSTELWAVVADLPLEMLQESRSELERQGVIFGNGLAHPLYQEVKRQSLSLDQRRIFARRAIAALEAEHPEEAAEFVNDARFEPEWALELLERAAASFERIGNVAGTTQVLMQATEYANGERRGQIALRVAQGMGKHADTERLIKMAELAASLLPENTEALLVLAERHAREGRRVEMNAALERLPLGIREGPQWMARHVHILFDGGSFEEVLALWQAQPDLHEHCDAETAYRVAYAFIERGDLEVATLLATQMFERPNLTDAERLPLLDALATVAFYEGRFTQAEHRLGEMVKAYRQGSDERGLANALRNHAVACLQLGQYHESLPGFEESIRIYTSWGASVLLAQTQVMVSPVFLELGEYQRAEAVLQEALVVLGRIPPQAFLIYGLSALATLYTRWSLPHSAALASKYAHDMLSIARMLKNPVLLANAFLGASVVESWFGRPAKGLELAEESLGLAKQIGFGEAIMSAHLARGDALKRLEHRSDALAAFREAEQLCAETGLVLEGHKVGLEIAHLTGDLERAREALNWFEARGLMNGVVTAHDYFPTLASGSPPQMPTSSEKPACLEILGPMQFGNKDKTEPVRGRKRQELLALLLEVRIAGRSEISRLELIDLLYPDSDEAKASASLKQNVRLVRASLGADAIQTTQHGYALGAVSSDAETFLKTGEVKLWRGAYLEGLLLEASDQTVRESLHLALFARAQALLENDPLENDPLEAARVGKILLAFDAYNLEYLNVCVMALRLGNNHKSLTRLYAQTRLGLLEVGEVLPERWQDFLTQVAHP